MDFTFLIVSGLFFTLLSVFFYYMYKLLKTYFETRSSALLAKHNNERSRNTLNLRLAAYERLCLLCERIVIPSLIMRLRTEGTSAADLRAAMLFAIQHEFEHNTTQQLYISENLWSILTMARNNTADIINIVFQKEEVKGDVNVYIKELLKFIGEQPADSLAQAQTAIRKEAAVLIN
jgi:hypothetical protein